MGTNYYFVDPVLCEHCGNPVRKADAGDSKKLHIGKSSAGWNFAVRIYLDMGILSLTDWEFYIKNNPSGKIFDEYGHEHSLGDLLQIIKNRPQTSKSHADCNRKSSRGEGTWDYCPYEFC